jgi:hypothetical protein
MSTVIKIKRSETPSQIPGAGSLEVGELAMNVTDGKFYTKTSGGTVKEIGGAGAVTLQDVTTSGAVTTNDITLNGADLVFEGNIENAFETILTVDEPTSDRTITLPNRSGTLAIIETGRNIVIEGTSYNTTVTTADPSANRTLTLPNQSGTLAMDGDALAYSIVFGG